MMPDPWSILSRPHDPSVIQFNSCTVRTEQKGKLKWFSDGLYYWTENWPHICSVVPISGAKFDEYAVRRIVGEIMSEEII